MPEPIATRIVEAARLTGSAMNAQPWHFIVVQDRDTLRELGRLARSGPYVADAPLAVVVVTDKSRFAVSDASRAIQSMVLTAWADGVGSNWAGFGGLDDLRGRRVRFIGDARQRIREDGAEYSALSPTGITVKKIGNGKMVYIREIIPASTGRVETRRIGVAGDETASTMASPARGGSFAAADWLLPKNHVEIQRAVTANLRDSASITTTAPLTTVLEILNRQKTSETIVHFVNFNEKAPLAPFQVRLRKQFADRKVTSVQFFKPEMDEPVKVAFTEQGGWITFTAPASKIYSMAVVAHQ